MHQGNIRWFVLASICLILNAFAVLRNTGPAAPQPPPAAPVAQAPAARVPVLLACEPAEVSGREPVHFRFSVAMDTGTPGAAAAAPPPIRFAPTVEGRFRWEGPTHLTFTPAADWRPETAYTATPRRDLKSRAGIAPAPAAAPASFTSERLRLLGVRQSSFARDREITVELTFNHPVDPQQVDKHLVLLDTDGSPVAHERLGETATREVRIRTGSLPDKSVALVVALRNGLTGMTGPLGLAPLKDEAALAAVSKLPLARKSWAGTAAAPPAAPPWPLADVADVRIFALSFVLKLTEVEVETNGPEEGEISVRFTAPVEEKSAAAAVAIEPAVAWHAVDWHGGLRLAGKFAAGSRYTLTFKKGLSAQNGATLIDDVRRIVVFDDVQPYARAEAGGTYLSAAAPALLQVETVNCPRFTVGVRRLFPNNLVHYARSHEGWSDRSDDLSEELVERAVFAAAETQKNRPARTVVDLGKLLGPEAHGALLVAVAGAGCYRERRHLLVISDLGVVAKSSGADLLVWVNSIRKAEAVPLARVTAWSRAGQALATGCTDAVGIARLGGLAGDRSPYVLTVEAAGDLTFLALGDRAGTELSTAEFNVGGRAWVEGGYEAHVFTDRGIYRPGETVRLGASVRDRVAAPPAAAFPVEWTVWRPDGRAFLRRTLTLSELGTCEVEVAGNEAMPSGRYRATLGLPGAATPFGVVGFSVEDFVPPQIEVAVALPEGRLDAGAKTPVTVRGRHLFGAAAAGLAVEARAVYTPERFTPPGWKAFDFGDATREGTCGTTTVELGKKTLDDKGEAAFDLPAYAGAPPASGLAVTLSATVTDVSGRTVTQHATRPVDVLDRYVGIHPAEESDWLAAGKKFAAEIALVTPDGKPAAGKVKAALCRVQWHTVLVAGTDGRNRYQSKLELVPVSEQELEVRDGRAAFAAAMAETGSFRLIVTDAESDARASTGFHVFGGAGEFGSLSLERPGRIEVTLDKPAYAAGERAEVRLRAPFAGRALVTVESDRVLFAQVVMIEGSTAQVSVPVTEEMWPNAYCAVHLIRPTGPETPWLPHRAFGVAPLALETASRRLAVQVEAPAELRPGNRLDVPVEVSDGHGTGVAAEVTLAAVDEGICAVTGFETPDPLRFYGAKRALGVRAHDVYAFLMPELEAGIEAAPPIAGGGDEGEHAGAAAAMDTRHLSPMRAARFRPVALWQGRTATDAAGRATLHVDVPEFTGRLRLMVVAVARRQFGAAERPVYVRRPLVVKSGLPRFLAPGDEFVLPVSVWNRTGAAGRPALAVTADGPLAVIEPGELPEIADGAEGAARLRLRAGATPGVARLTLAVALGAEKHEETLEIAVRPPVGLVSTGGIGMLDQGGRVAVQFPADYLPGTRRVGIKVSSFPATQWENALRDLLHYPYGCVEQTTSSVFPLLYLGEIAEAAAGPDRLSRAELDARVQAGIERLLSMQTATGGFGYWPRDRETSRFGSLYATHFLVEAERAGFAVPHDLTQGALAYLDTLVVRSVRPSGDEVDAYRECLSEKAYALFVLALAGQRRVAPMNSLVEKAADLEVTARCHLAAALVAGGRGDEARKLLAGPAAAAADGRASGGMLNSGVREDAILLSVRLDADPNDPEVGPLVGRLMAAQHGGRWATTQENAFAAMALGKFFRVRPPRRGDVRGRVVLAGGDTAASAFTREKPLSLTVPDGTNGATIEAEGEGLVFYAWGADGVPASGQVAEKDVRLRVRRTLLDRDGKPIADGRVRQGQLVRVRLSISADRDVENLVISDLLPAGLEIENPRLAISEKDDKVEKAERAVRSFGADRVEMRDDRLLLFGRAGAYETRFEYLARAVTAGRFTLPPVSGECMYDPEVSSVNGAGTLEVGE